MVRFGARDAALLDKMYASLEIVEQRARTRAALGARPGERGLEVGCGPGFLASEMAREVGPDGRIVAIDTSDDMLATARARLAREGLEARVDLALGDATRLAFPPGSFDFVVGVQVYCYVDEIEAALAEAARVLKPGGRCLIVDTDFDSCVWLSEDRERTRRMVEARTLHFAQPHLPPRLPALLRGAGLTLARAATIPLVSARYDPDSFGVSLIGVTRDIALRHGVERAEVEAWETDLRGRTGEGDWFFSLDRFLFLAVKPI
jgi:arsenite methyltransferase